MRPESDFERLIEKHKGILYKVSRAYGGTAGLADDLAQEIAVQLWRGFPAFDAERAKFSTWMYRIALNVAISFQRRERIRSHQPLEELIQTCAPDSSSASDSDELRMLYGWIDKLERSLDKALVLLFLEGEPYRGIAEILGISETNVATRLARLKEAMRKDLGGR